MPYVPRGSGTATPLASSQQAQVISGHVAGLGQIPADPGTPTLASMTDLYNSAFEILVRNLGPTEVQGLLSAATQSIEDRCGRRLAPFTVTESHRSLGVESTAGSQFPGLLGDTGIAGSLGYSAAMGVSDLPRHLWLRQFPPLRSDLWAYTAIGIVILPPTGGQIIVPTLQIEGPDPDTGHIRFTLGTYNPQGSTIRVTYSGGYATPPWALQRATLLQVAKLAILDAEPEDRKGLDQNELDVEIAGLIAPYAR